MSFTPTQHEIKDGNGTPFQMYFLTDSTGTNADVPVHATINISGTLIDPATDETVAGVGAAITTALGTDGTSPPSFDGGATGVRGWLRQIWLRLATGAQDASVTAITAAIGSAGAGNAAPALPSGAGGLMGVVQWVGQRLPPLGPNTSANALPVVLATDGFAAAFGTPSDAAATTGSTSGSAIAWYRGIFGALNTIATTVAAAIPAGANLIGKVGIDQTTPGTTNAVAMIDGANAALGAKADAAATTASTSGSAISWLRGCFAALTTIATNGVASAATLTTIATTVAAATPAGTNIVGKVGIDQTTPGTTNAVAMIDGANAALGAKADAAATTASTSGSAISWLRGCFAALTTIATNGVASAATLTTIATTVAAATPAGTNIVGKVGIDQTTPGTTNAVAMIDGGNATLGAKADAAATTSSTSGSAIAWLRGIFGALNTIATTVAAAVPAGTNLIGKVGIDQTAPGTTNAVAMIDGGCVTLGAKADAAATTSSTSGSAIAWLRGIFGALNTIATTVAAAIPAGANLIGKVGIDQTTPGTTNAVAMIDGANATLGAKADAAATTASGSGSVVAWLRGILVSTTKLITPLTCTDKSGTNSATVGTFTTAIAANSARQTWRVSNPNSSGMLYVYDKGAGTPTLTNSVVVLPYGAIIVDACRSGAAIQVAASVASLAFEAMEGV